MKKIALILLLLTSCTGAGLTGGGASPAGPVGGEVGGGPEQVVAGNGAAMSGSDGTLGSQSSSSDINVYFIRDYALDFENEAEPSEVVIDRPMAAPTKAFGDAEVRKVSSTVKGLNVVSVPNIEKADTVSSAQVINPAVFERYVRAIYCGNFPDSEIEKLIPAEEAGQPWAQDKLLWFVLRLPRPNSPGTVECHNPTYRDFLVKDGSKVDLSDFHAVAQDVIFFVLVNSSDYADGGALSTDQASPLSDSQWLALAQKFKLRIVRLSPSGTIHLAHPVSPALQRAN